MTSLGQQSYWFPDVDYTVATAAGYIEALKQYGAVISSECL